MIAFLVLVGLLIIDIIIIIAVKYKEEIWYIIYERMGWLENEKPNTKTVYKNKNK